MVFWGAQYYIFGWLSCVGDTESGKIWLALSFIPNIWIQMLYHNKRS